MALLPRTLASRLTLVLNAALVFVIGAFTFWEYTYIAAERLDAKRAALDDEARIIAQSLVTLQPLPGEAIQTYLNLVCADMRGRYSPGHYILLDLGGKELEASIHVTGALTAEERAVVRAAAWAEQFALIRQRRMLAGHAQLEGPGGGSVSVYVAEYVTDIQRAIQRALVRRAVAIGVTLLALGLILNVLVDRFVRRPLGSLRGAMEQAARGRVGVTATLPEVEELRRLGDEFNRMSQALAQAEADRRARLDRARRLQERLLPRLGAVGAWRLDGFYIPADSVAGDYWDVVECPEGAALVCLADVSGHGVPAAMSAAMLKVLVTDAAVVSADPAEILKRVNARYFDLSLDDEFATMLLMVLSREGDRLTYASAGHEAAVLLSRQGGEPRLLEATGPPIGIDRVQTWTARSVLVVAGDRVVAVTDGVVEVENAAKAPFGRERLLKVLAGLRSRPIDGIVAGLRQAVTAHLAGATAADDMTVVGLESGPRAAG